MAAPRWLVDEMLGRLARYLRFVGCDTVYVRGVTDDELIERARREDRRIITRDRALARRVPGALLVEGSEIGEQWIAVRSACPELPTEVAFLRCSKCNGDLRPYDWGSDPTREAFVPEARRRDRREVYACRECGQLYWEGSHTSRIRSRLAAWDREAVS